MMPLPKLPIPAVLLSLLLNATWAAEVGLPAGWTHPTGDLIFSSAAMATDGTLYVGSNDHQLHALNPDGSTLWTFLTGDWIDSTPVVGTEGTIYFGGWDNFIYALNADGTLRWKYQTGSAVIGSPTLADGLVITGSLDGFCYALNADSGEFVWAYLADTELHTSPLHADGRVFLAGYDGTIHCVNALTGEGLWSANTDTLPPLIKPTALRRIYASPVRASEDVILFATGSGVLFAFDPFGQLLWSFEATAEIDSAPVIDQNGEIYFGCRDGLLYNLTPDGFIDWAVVVGRVYYSSPAVGRGNWIYVVGAEDIDASRLYQLDDLGFELNSVDLSALNDASPLITPDGFLCVGMHDGTLYQFDPMNPPAESTWPQFQQTPARDAAHPKYWQPYREWLAQWFGQATAADPTLAPNDHDSFDLLAEFALGLNPTISDGANTTITLDGDDAEASIWKYVGARDIITHMESGSHLDLFDQPVVTPNVIAKQGNFEQISARTPVEGPALFMRFRFEEF